MELAEDQHGPLDAFRSPPSRRLERGEDLVETGTEVFEDVVPVQTHAVPSMQRAGGRVGPQRLSPRVTDGEVVLISDGGRVVAEPRHPSAEGVPSPAEPAPGRLVAAGVLTIGLPQNPSSYQRTGVRIACPSQTLLDAERGDQ